MDHAFGVATFQPFRPLRVLGRSVTLGACLLLGGLTGCMGSPANPAATQPTTHASKETTDPLYWFKQPGVASYTYGNFRQLWTAAQKASRDAGFYVDREDVRDGLMTTQPLISKSAVELWRGDVVNVSDLANSTLHTLRRTIWFEFARQPDGRYRVVPKVVVERFSITEHRVTSAAQYREVFALTRQEAAREKDRQENLLLSQDGIPTSYWYPIGRDPDLEKDLVERIDGHLDAEPPGPTPTPASPPPAAPDAPVAATIR